MIAPVCLFVHKRLDATKKTIHALSKNSLASNTILFIFSDGGITDDDKNEVRKVRSYLQTVTGFLEVNIIENEKNLGLAKSVISGVSKVVSEYDQVIVLEDDLVTSQNFLEFMNKALEFYKDSDNVFSISGYSLPMKKPDNYFGDVYIAIRGSSWGWATWKNEWQSVDWDVAGYDEFMANPSEKKRFNNGGEDLVRMLKRQMSGEINSWAIRWCYSQFRQDKYTVYPFVTKVKNIGFTKQATHTKNRRLFEDILDESFNTDFLFVNDISVNEYVMKQFRAYYSNLYKIKTKLLNVFR